MSPNMFEKEQKITKTERALYSAMYSLLRNISFKKMTIKGICEEALVSRAAFYAHYFDKFDLLAHWMMDFWPMNIGGADDYDKIERAVNLHVQENALIIKNLLSDADNETHDILFDCILSTLNLPAENGRNGDLDPKNAVLSNFYAGGFISYLSWQVGQSFPTEVPLMNRYVYELINIFQDWQSK